MAVYALNAFHSNFYFLVVMFPTNYTLLHLDSFLRYTWVECCMHSSGFSFYKQQYGPSLKKSNPLSAFQAGTKLEYQYDFGTPTELLIEFIGVVDDVQVFFSCYHPESYRN